MNCPEPLFYIIEKLIDLFCATGESIALFFSYVYEIFSTRSLGKIASKSFGADFFPNIFNLLFLYAEGVLERGSASWQGLRKSNFDVEVIFGSGLLVLLLVLKIESKILSRLSCTGRLSNLLAIDVWGFLNFWNISFLRFLFSAKASGDYAILEENWLYTSAISNTPNYLFSYSIRKERVGSSRDKSKSSSPPRSDSASLISICSCCSTINSEELSSFKFDIIK